MWSERKVKLEMNKKGISDVFHRKSSGERERERERASIDSIE